MRLTKSQQVIWERSRSVGAGAQAVVLTDPICAYLIGRIATDLGLKDEFLELPLDLPDFFGRGDLDQLVIDCEDARPLFERLVVLNSDADMYYACLATLHKARLKYETILETQPIPTLEQVGPRGLLQYGKLSSKALSALLFWRKWFYDIDNRAGQETGYLFEPIIAFAVGGTPVTATKSPVKRHRNKKKGRQVDCLLGKKAYEIKLRVTIAASGQGRWQEELDFPLDCKTSGYTPVLIVLDGTPNAKLDELEHRFRAHRGEVYKGEDAWNHLDTLAGQTMSHFIETYVRQPIDHLLKDADESLPELVARMDAGQITISVAGEVLEIKRDDDELSDAGDGDELPPDFDEGLPGYYPGMEVSHVGRPFQAVLRDLDSRRANSGVNSQTCPGANARRTRSQRSSRALLCTVLDFASESVRDRNPNCGAKPILFSPRFAFVCLLTVVSVSGMDALDIFGFQRPIHLGGGKRSMTTSSATNENQGSYACAAGLSFVFGYKSTLQANRVSRSRLNMPTEIRSWPTHREQ